MYGLVCWAGNIHTSPSLFFDTDRLETHRFRRRFRGKITHDNLGKTDAISRSSNQLIAEANAVAGIS
jgi:hypothetical protein